MRKLSFVALVFAIGMAGCSGGCDFEDVSPVDPQSRWASPHFISLQGKPQNYQTNIQLLNVAIRPVVVRLEFRNQQGVLIPELGDTLTVPIRGSLNYVVKSVADRHFDGSVQLIGDGPILPAGQVLAVGLWNYLETMEFYAVRGTDEGR